MSKRSWALLLIILLMCLAGTYYFAGSLRRITERHPPWDYTVNWLAANAMRQHISLYSTTELHELGLDLVGPHTTILFQDTFTSYIGLPSTALLHLPLTLLTFPESVVLYRMLLLILFIVSIFVSGLILPGRSRYLGWVIGILALLLFQPVILSIGLGQVDAFVMVSLAFGIWAISRERWYLAGVAIGLATLLKISPLLLLLYLLLRGKRQSVIGAAITGFVLLGLSAMVGRADDLWTFIHQVAPSLSDGSLHTQNLSFPAWLARLSLPDTELLTFTRGVGEFNLAGLPLAVIITIVFYLCRRRLEPSPLDFAFLILLALLAGPITWDHYASWSILPLVLCCDARWWRNLRAWERTAIVYVGAACAELMVARTLYFDSAAIADNWSLRLLSGTKTIGLLLWSFGVLYLIVRSRPSVGKGNITSALTIKHTEAKPAHS
jgi:alpha-1,2-mannosyltransferase